MSLISLKKASLLATAALLSASVVGTAAAQSIRFWTTEEQPDRLAKQEQLAEDFKAESGITVEVIPVTESELGQRATAAFAAGDLPDVIYFTLQYALPWAEAGILDIDADTEIVEDLGVDTFAPGALNMAEMDGDYVAVPVDGWTQMIVYRKDLFEENGLEPPTTYEAIGKAIDVLHNPPDMYGFVAATKVDENFMSQVLEHVFLANGLSPVDENGIAPMDEAQLVETLNFYKTVADASPEGELYWQQSRELYFAGKAAMIIWSPFILDELAGLRDDAPPTINDDPTSTELAEKTGVVATFAGPSNPDGAAWADIRYFGVSTDANTDAAMQFIEYSMDDGYMQTLSIAPEGKFPVRRGTADDPEKFVNGWAQLPVGVDRKAALTDLYAPEVVNTIVSGLETANRWGVKEGQLSAASKVINSQVINRIVRRFLDDEITAEEAAKAINEEIAKVE
jgi:multiple sugar transport system substrate-binding protein